MRNLDSPDSTHTPISQDLLLKMEPQTNKVLDDIAALLEREGIEDATDQRLVAEAVAFIQNPTEDLSDIIGHTINTGRVLAGYITQEVNPPPEIGALDSHLYTLQCINRIKFIEEELSQGTPADSPEIRKAMSRGLDWATTLAIGHNDHLSLVATFHELQAKLNSLQNPPA